MTEFFAICEYFGITAIEFFNGEVSNPKLMQKTVCGLERLEEKDLELIQLTVDRLLK